MVFREFEKVLLVDGTVADVLEVFDGGAAYLVEFAVEGGDCPYDDRLVYPDEIERAL